MTKQNIIKEAYHLDAEGTELKNKVKASIKRVGHTTNNQVMAERTNTIWAKSAKMKRPWKVRKK